MRSTGRYRHFSAAVWERMMQDFAWRQLRAEALSDLEQRQCTVYPAISRGWTTSKVGHSTPEPAVEGSVSHRGSVISAKESQHFPSCWTEEWHVVLKAVC